jgi:hypothetical protein
MYKNLYRVRIGGWWLLAGVWSKRDRPFMFYYTFTFSTREVWLRVFWLEVGITELPF